jgi:hypothetical protein
MNRKVVLAQNPQLKEMTVSEKETLWIERDYSKQKI